MRGGESLSLELQAVKVEGEITSLKSKKNEHQKKIKFHQDRGSSWQFNRDSFLESRHEYLLADRELDKIRIIDLKIQDLNELRLDLLE